MIAETVRIQQTAIAEVVEVVHKLEPDAGATVAAVREENGRYVATLLWSRYQQLKASVLCFHEDSLDVTRKRTILRWLRAPSEGGEGPECLDHSSRLSASRQVSEIVDRCNRHIPAELCTGW